jgi:hypothetical protein
MAWKQRIYTSEITISESSGGGEGGNTFFVTPRNAAEENTDLLKVDIVTREVTVLMSDVWVDSFAGMVVPDQSNSDIIYTGRWSNGWGWWNNFDPPGQFTFVKIDVRNQTKTEVTIPITVTDPDGKNPMLDTYNEAMFVYNEDCSEFYFVFEPSNSGVFSLAKVSTSGMTCTVWEDVLTSADVIRGPWYFAGDVYMCTGSYGATTTHVSTDSVRDFTPTTWPFAATDMLVEGQLPSPNGAGDPRYDAGGTYIAESRAYIGIFDSSYPGWVDGSSSEYFDEGANYVDYTFYLEGIGCVRMGDKIVMQGGYSNNLIVIDMVTGSVDRVLISIDQDPYDEWGGDYSQRLGILGRWSSTEIVIVSLFTAATWPELTNLSFSYHVFDITTGELTDSSPIQSVTGEQVYDEISTMGTSMAVIPGGSTPITTTVTPYGLYKLENKAVLVGYAADPPPPASNSSSGSPFGGSTTSSPSTELHIVVGDNGRVEFFSGDIIYITI